MTYDEAMSRYGSDKPDLRFQPQILRIDNFVSPEFVSMITKLEKPVVEAAQFRLGGTLEEKRTFIRTFMDNIPKTPLKLSGDATPGIFVFDESKPLNGLSAFGHEAAEKLATHETKHWPKLQSGDIIVVHARKDVPFHGEGWTDLGKLQKAIYQAAMDEKLIRPKYAWGFCWVTKFPLFTPNDPESIAAGEGQGEGRLLLDPPPLHGTAKADHYDLICRGVEIGGGSRRIHVAELQEYVMRDVLQMTDAGVRQFSHLLEALRAGCPPHAGFAFGWDRFVSILAGVDSVRDVIAFPKSMNGEDKFVRSPTKMTKAQLEAYHLMLAKNATPDSEDTTTPTFEPVSAAPEFEPSPSDIPVPGDEPIPGSTSAETDNAAETDNVVENDDAPANENSSESVNTPENDTTESVKPSESESENINAAETDHVVENINAAEADNVIEKDDSAEADIVIEKDDAAEADNVAKNDDAPANENSSESVNTPENDTTESVEPSESENTPAENDSVAENDSTAEKKDDNTTV
ncbi:hypothetical protein PG999_010497 [Apiospora kogelbergensis]|uniref:Aminoacyl-tRNA synthetase class II (D/K/N) domain-containing protein n=1 Tax=Apiospora kogelbergensis TaxID=1337665 RepID=A0AAW0QRN9_9PEZI